MLAQKLIMKGFHVQLTAYFTKTLIKKAFQIGISDPGLESPETGREDFLITPAGGWLLFLAQLGNVVMFVI